jgi:hypothetical protein
MQKCHQKLEILILPNLNWKSLSKQKTISDFKNQKYEFALFTNPFAVDVYDSPEELQMKLIEIQSNDGIKTKFSNTDLIGFYQYLQKYFPDSYTKIRNNALKFITMFGTYRCQQLFSSLKFNKSKQRSSLTDKHLNDCMKIITANDMSPNIHKIVSNMQFHHNCS